MNGFKAIIFIICLPVLLIIMIYYMDIAYIKSEVPVNNMVGLNIWIFNNIKYKSDCYTENNKKILRDDWQYPRETLLLKTGDCDDQSILFVYLCKKLLKIDCKAVWFVSKKNQGHLAVLYEDTLFDPTYNIIAYAPEYQYYYLYVVKKTYTYEELLKEIPKRRNLVYKY